MLSLNQDLYNFVLVFYLFFNEILNQKTKKMNESFSKELFN